MSDTENKTGNAALDAVKAMEETQPARRPLIAAKTAGDAPALLPDDPTAGLPQPVETPVIDAKAPLVGPGAKTQDALARQDKVAEFEENQRREQQEAAQRELDRLAAENAEAGEAGLNGDDVFIFIAKYPSLTLYVKAGVMAQGRDGSRMEIDSAINFRQGVYKADRKEAEALREHPRFNKLFREEKSRQNSAIRQALAIQRDSLTSPTMSGPTASSDGAETQMLAEDRKLAAAEQQLVDL